MPSSTFTVQPGTARQVGTGLKGAIIYNNDSVNTVWLGSIVNTQQSTGIPLGPLGNTTWESDGTVFAVTGSSSVNITISNDVSTLDNPVAVAAASAALLLANGIPNVLIQDTLYIGNLPVLNSNTGWLLTAKYSSLIMSSDLSVSANQFTYSFSNDGITASSTDWFTGLNFQQIPVRGKWFKVTSRANTVANITVLGTNRQLSTGHDQVFGNDNLPSQFSIASSAFGAGSISQFPIANPTRYPTGACALSGSLSSGTAARGIINYVYTDESLNLQSIPLTDTGEWHLDNPAGALFICQKPIILPNVRGFALNFQCRVAGSTAVTISIISDVR